MSDPHVNTIKVIWLAVGLVIGIFVGYIVFVGIAYQQVANERESCRSTKLDQMNRADYQYCLSIESKK